LLDAINSLHQLIQDISNKHPGLKIERDEHSPVESAFVIPVQDGLKHQIWLGLQNVDELHLVIGELWVDWFPCFDTKNQIVFVDAVNGFIAGTYRVVQHFKHDKYIGGELQKLNGSIWENKNSHAIMQFSLPWTKTQTTILSNAD
jgi:hypothetical protein